MKKREIVKSFLEKGILIGSDLLEELKEESKVDKIYELIRELPGDILVLGDDTKSILSKLTSDNVNWVEFDKTKVLSEKGKKDSLQKFIDSLTETEPKPKKNQTNNGVRVIFSYEESLKKREMQDFVDYFNNRYKAIEPMLRNRPELSNATSIGKLLLKKDKSEVSAIGVINAKQSTKNKNIMLTVEDQTGAIKVLVNKNKSELYRIATNLVLDSVVGVKGFSGDKIIFANNIYLPDIPNRELKKCKDETYCLFLSDLHVGSSYFLSEDFERFIKWINGEIGSESQRRIALNVKYIFIAGDLVDGCGIYPGQEDDLEIKDIYAQYEECARLLRGIPSHIPLIICPGNHDAVRVAEPQPPFQKDFCEPLFKLPNTVLVSNPSIVNIHSSEEFQGFDVLMYHGYSFDHFVAEVDYLRNNGGYDRADLIMQFLLQLRHLAPTHTSTLYLPDVRKDYLTIEKVPDFFVSGHIHKSISSNYKSVTMICGSCWQGKTSYQEKVGHNPEPSRVPIVNLQTREVKILKFG